LSARTTSLDGLLDRVWGRVGAECRELTTEVLRIIDAAPADDRLRNYCPRSFEELEATVRAEMAALKASPETVARAIRHTELPIHTIDEFLRADGVN
jgi:hypothetical protein